ncbi:MAG: YceI family protein [Flammeovirgaceae bacterium]|nr:YceI family protein [Flammeovirgaceae bacterium]
MNILKISSVITLLIGLTTSVFAQKFITKNGHTSFYSEAPMENIEAHNKEVLSIIDFESNEIVTTMLMNGFQFKKSLMQEHFNEKYVESDQFPKATFKGKFTPNETIDLSKDGNYELAVTGTLTIHGVTKPIDTSATIEVKDGAVSGKTNFNVKVEDYDISIPKVVVENIAETVLVTSEFTYSPYSN